MGVFLIGTDRFKPYLEKIRTREATAADLRALNALHRINIVSTLVEAGHGWLGASFSCVELLSTIFHRFIPDPLRPIQERNSLILSKGHGVVTQYAVLASMGIIPLRDLLTYKKKGGLPAHCEKETPGVDSASGSLGQGISRALGLIRQYQISGRKYKCFALLGDGELQEGQVFESLLTLRQSGETACLPIIDRNFLQSDSRVADIKDAADWPGVFRGIGFEVFVIDGHNPEEIALTLDACHVEDKPCLIIAETVKGYGTSVTGMNRDTPRRKGVWHGQIPNAGEYLTIVAELVTLANDAAVTEAFQAFRSVTPDQSSAKTVAPTQGGPATGEAFGKCLVEKAGQDPFWVLSADLEKACRLSAFAQQFPHRFIEVGISEQDMVSQACGIGLAGGIAVVNTYASFLKRAYDQIFSACSERLPVIFAGHYAGLDYFSDGKTHQSLNDIGFMRMFPDLEVFEPINEAETTAIFEYLLRRMRREISERLPSRPAYIRLHRQGSRRAFRQTGQPSVNRPHLHPGVPSKDGRRIRIFVAAPHFVDSALHLQERFLQENISLDVVRINSYQDPDGSLKKILAEDGRAFVLESHLPQGGLGDFLRQLEPRSYSCLGPTQLSPCTRTLADQLSFHRLDDESLYLQIKERVILDRSEHPGPFPGSRHKPVPRERSHASS